MKILLLSHTGLATGGAEQCLIEYVNVLKNKGHVCKVIVPHDGDLVNRLAKNHIETEIIGFSWATIPPKRAKAKDILISNGSGIARIYRFAEEFNPDIIITNTAVIPWGFYVARALNVPTVLLAHEILNEKDPSLAMYPNYQTYMSMLNKTVDYIIYNSQFVKAEYEGVLTKPTPADEILYPLPPLDKKQIDKYYKENHFRPVLKIAILGALSKRKNQLEALEAISILKESGIDNIRLDLFGSVNDVIYVKKLKKYIRKQKLSKIVKIKGYTNDVYKTINTYNVVLSTATYEPFGRSIVEGQLFGRMVISNQTGGGSELVKDGVTGLIYKSGKPEQLADKISWILSNTEESVKISLRAKEVQFRKYITSSRYDPLVRTIESAYKSRAEKPLDQRTYDPIKSLVEYGLYLHDRHRKIERLYRNRLTRPVARLLRRLKHLIKISIKKIIYS